MGTKKECSVKDCTNQHYGKGLCEKHYASNRRKNNIRKCTVEGCDRAYVSNGYCGAHYRRVLKNNEVGTAEVQRREFGRKCDVEGCGRKHRTGGLCEAHAARKRRGVGLVPPVLEYDPTQGCSRQGCSNHHAAKGYCSTHISREHHLWTKYGLTYAEFDALFDSQHGMCAGNCGRELQRDNDSKHTHVDHSHETGQIRGILCHRCNTGLGLLGDSVEGLERMLAYLRRSEVEVSSSAFFA